VFVCWKAGRPYLQEAYWDKDRKQFRSRCYYLGHDPVEARDRLAELVKDSEEVDKLAARLEATWTPKAEAEKMAARVTRLWEAANHPAVKGELAICAAALDRLAGKDAPGGHRRGDLD